MRCRAGFRGALRGGDGARNFPRHAGRGRAGMGQEKSMWGGDEDPILRPRLAPPHCHPYSQVRWGKIAIHTGKVNRQDAHCISYPSIKDYSLEHLIKLFKLLKEKKKEAVTLFEIYNTRSSHFHHKNGQLCSFQKASLVSLYPDLKKFCTKLLGKMQKSPI